MESKTVGVHRVRLSEQEFSALEQLTKKYGCTYNGKLSISALLSQIAEGRLKISRSEILNFSDAKADVPLIELDIEVLSNLNGTIACIAKKISEFGGNIYRARAVENNAGSHVRMDISTPTDRPLVDLFNSLYKITVADIIDFNEEDKLGKLLAVIDEEINEVYIKDKRQNPNKKINAKEYINLTVSEDNKSKSIIKNIVTIIGFEFILENRRGTLWQLAEKLAEKRI